MAKGRQETKLDLVIGAVDRFTEPLRKLNEAVSRNTQGFRRLGSAVSRLKQETGINKLVGGVKQLGSSVLRVGDGFAAVTSRFARLSGILSLALGVAGGGLGALATESAAAGREVERLSARAGVAAEPFQRLAYAASGAGVDADAFASVLSDLGEKAVDAATGNEDLQKTFKALRIDIRTANGDIKKSDALFAELADAFARMEDGQTKTSIALQLVSEEGARLIPVLNQGTVGLRNMGDEAQRLGLVLDRDALSNSSAFTKGVEQLSSTLKGLGFTVGQALIPVLLPLIERLRDWAAANRDLVAGKVREWVERFAARLPELVRAGEQVLAFLGSLFQGLGKLSDALGGADRMLGVVAAVLSGPLLLSLAGAAKAFLALGAAILTTPVGWVLAAAAAVAAGIYLLVKRWDKVKEAFKTNPVYVALTPLIALAKTLKGEWQGFGDFFRRLWNNLLGEFAGIVNRLTNMLPDWLKDWMGIDGGRPVINVPELKTGEGAAGALVGTPSGVPAGVPTVSGSLPGVTNTEVKRTENVVRLIVPEGYEIVGEGDAAGVVYSDDSALGYMGA